MALIILHLLDLTPCRVILRAEGGDSICSRDSGICLRRQDPADQRPHRRDSFTCHTCSWSQDALNYRIRWRSGEPFRRYVLHGEAAQTWLILCARNQLQDSLPSLDVVGDEVWNQTIWLLGIPTRFSEATNKSLNLYEALIADASGSLISQ